MTDSGRPYEDDVGRLLAASGEPVEMADDFRSRLLRTTHEAVTSRRRGRWPRRALTFAAGLAALVAAAYLYLAPSSLTPEGVRTAVLLGHRGAQPVLTVSAVQAPATGRLGLALHVGDRLPAGASVSTGSEGRITLLTRKGSEFTLNERSAFALGADRASGRLERGELYCRSRLHEVKRIVTEAGEIRLLGTTLGVSVKPSGAVAVTVVEGKVKLANARGTVVVPAGRKAVLTLAQGPGGSVPADAAQELAWYDGRGRIVSDTGRIVYTVMRKSEEFLAQEVWTMRADGSDKRFVKAYIGCVVEVGPWLADSPWVMVASYYAKTGSVSTKDRKVVGEGGGPILRGQQAWLLDTSTGNEVRFVSLPEGYYPYAFRISPQAKQVLVSGIHWLGYPHRPPERGAPGPWLYTVASGELRALPGAGYSGRPSWSPDGRTLATYSAEDYDLTKSTLRLVDVATGEAKELGDIGWDPVFSPDGTRLAYCTDYEWRPAGEYRARVSVLDLRTMRARAITGPTKRAEYLSWSPDGKSVVYVENHETYTDPDDGIVLPDYMLCTAAADGSGVRQLYRAKEYLRVLCWSEAGDAIYVSTSEGVHRVTRDGEVTDLGGTERDSVLTPAQQRDMTGALEALRNGIYWFTIAQGREAAADLAPRRAAFLSSAEAFGSLPWRYPQAQFSVAQVLLHADRAQAEAGLGDAEVRESVCYWRVRGVGFDVMRQAAEHRQFPPDLATAKAWVLADSGTPEYTELRFAGCPSGGEWVYTPPTGMPKAGDVMVRCGLHAENTWAWSERDVDSYATMQKRSRE